MAVRSTVVLAITRQMGAGGAYVGQAVARRLSLKYLDREILEEAAKQLGAEDAGLEQMEERVAGIWMRMARHLSFGPPDGLFTPPQPHSSLYEEDLFRVEREIIRNVAAHEDCVIIGRAGSFVLRDHPGVVKVFLHAPEALRVKRLSERLPGYDRQALTELVRRSDMDRARFVHAVCTCDWSDACHYDLTLDTGTTGLDGAADIVGSIVEGRLRQRATAL